MRIFTRDGKTNFVDDKNTVVGYDSQDCCCEAHGYAILKAEPTAFDRAFLELALPDGSEYSNFNFDTNYFKELPNDGMEEGGAVVFRLKGNMNQIYLVLYNIHNGYYLHGFDVKVGGTEIRTGTL